MEKATEIFEKHWTKATGRPLDDATKHHMKYAIEAINEAIQSLPNSADIRQKALYSDEKEFDTWWWGTVYKFEKL